MEQTDREQLCAFFQRSRYDIIQASQGDGWGTVWIFAPCDAKAAQKAGQILLKMHLGEPLRVRHARRVRLRDRRHTMVRDVIVVTALPEREQVVFGLEDGIVLRVSLYFQDDALAALEMELVKPLR